MVNIIRTPKESSTSLQAAEVGEIDTRAPFQSVKAAVSLFGETISTPTHATKPSFHKKSKSQVEGVLDKETEYHFAQKELGKCKSQVKYAETAANKALPELEKAMKTLFDLKDKLKSVNESTQAIVEDTEALNIKATELEEAKSSNDHHAKVGNDDTVNACRQEYKVASAELDAAKQELSGLHGDFNATMEAKTDALQTAEEAQFAMKTHSEKITQLSEEIERMKESLDEVKLSTEETREQQAKMSAEKDEQERAHRATKEEFKMKIAALLQEKENESLDGVEAIELKIAEMNKEIEILKDQVEEARAALSESEKNTYAELNTAQEELKQVEQENQSLQEAVNALKLELGNVGKEIAETRDKEEQEKSLAGQLREEMQERKNELEAALASEGKDTNAQREIATRLEQLFLETKKAKREAEETNITAEELRNEIRAAEETGKKVELAMKEAEEVKTAERSAQNELGILKERSDAARATALANRERQKKVSKEEYESLKERASGSEKIFESKAASAHAEIEALKANKVAAEMKLERILREIEEIDKATGEAFKQAEMADGARSMVESELQRRREEQQAADVVVS